MVVFEIVPIYADLMDQCVWTRFRVRFLENGDLIVIVVAVQDDFFDTHRVTPFYLHL